MRGISEQREEGERFDMLKHWLEMMEMKKVLKEGD